MVAGRSDITEKEPTVAINPADLGAKRFIQVRTTLIESHGLLDAAIIGLIDFRSSGADAVTDEDGSWWRVSMPELAKLLGMSTNTITRHLDALLTAGDLVRVKHQVEGVHDQTYSYRVQVSGESNHSKWVGGDHSKRVDVPSTSEVSIEQGAPDLLDGLQEPQLVDRPPFDVWWQMWPKKVARADAERAFRKAVKLVPLDHLLDLTATWVDATNDLEKQYLPNGATWLNGLRWLEADQQRELRAERDRVRGQQQPNQPRPQRFDRPQDDDTLGAPAKGWDL